MLPRSRARAAVEEQDDATFRIRRRRWRGRLRRSPESIAHRRPATRHPFPHASLQAPIATQAPAPRTRRRRKRVATHSRNNLRSEEHTSELQSPCNLVCRLLLEKKKKKNIHC